MSLKGIRAVVTGGSGFVGQRLVEMLIERGASRVVSFDIAPKPTDALNDDRIVYQKGDITRCMGQHRACNVKTAAIPAEVLTRAPNRCTTGLRMLTKPVKELTVCGMWQHSWARSTNATCTMPSITMGRSMS